MGDVRLTNVGISAVIAADLMKPIGGVATGVYVAGATHVELHGASISARAGERGTAKGVDVQEVTSVELDGSVSAGAGAGGDASGVTVRENSEARIKASVTASTSNGRASGIGCGTNCTITQTSVVLSNRLIVSGSPISMSSGGIGCGAGCSLTESTVESLQEPCYNPSSQVGQGTSICSSTTTGVRVSGGGGFISRNVIEAGCGLAATGLYVGGSARVENNYVTVGCGGHPRLQYAFGAVLAGDVDLHSNSIFSYGSQPWGAGCGTVGACVANGSRATIRNNIFGAGECTARYHFAELCPYPWGMTGLLPANPVVFEHNAFAGDSTPRYFDNDSWSTLLSLEQINAMPDVVSSGNLFGSSGIDAGTPTGAPLVDIDGQARDEYPDVGADEWHDLCTGACTNGHCASFNSTQYCACDAGYANAAGAPLDCGNDFACRTNPALFQCLDVDECASSHGGCDPLTACNNLPGSRSCGPCPEGYLGNGETGCLPPPEPFVGLAGSCALEQSGHVYCWGAARQNPPLQGASFVKISGGSGDVCGLAADGSVTCTTTAAPPGEFLDVSAGTLQSCGMRPDHTIECWGAGPGATEVPAGAFETLATGATHACARRSDGSVACWGSNQFQQLSVPAESFTTLCSGSFQSCGLRADGSIACWGDAAIWLADYTPPPSGSFEQIFCGRRFACAMDAEGALQCWGQEPGRVPPEGVFVTASLGGDFGCALTQEGSAVCWGSDTGGDIHPP
jgi:hypothetical protein